MICFTPFQCLRVGAELNLANKLTENAIFGLVHCANYTKHQYMILQDQVVLHFLLLDENDLS